MVDDVVVAAIGGAAPAALGFTPLFPLEPHPPIAWAESSSWVRVT